MTDKTLDELANGIIQSIKNENISSSAEKWNRAVLYKQAREYFKTDKAFGDWLVERFTAGGKPESSNVISKLIGCTEIMNSQEFIKLKYTKAVEFVNKKMWKDYSIQMRKLLDMALVKPMSKGDIRDAIENIKNGYDFEQEDKRPQKSVKEELNILRAKLSVYEDNFCFSEKDFFSPVDEVRSLQLHRLSHSTKYMWLFFDISEGHTEEEIKRSYKRLATQYHPDKGGSDELMSLLNDIRFCLLTPFKIKNIKS